jgi:hypothetical protein
MSRLVGLVLISSGAAVCVAGSAAFWSLQSSATTGSLWPLPALVLLDWGTLGFFGYITAPRGDAAQPDKAGHGSWAISGALLPLAAIGTLSIGPYVLLSALLFLAGAAWRAETQSGITRQDLGWLVGGIIGNLALLLLFTTLG